MSRMPLTVNGRSSTHARCAARAGQGDEAVGPPGSAWTMLGLLLDERRRLRPRRPLRPRVSRTIGDELADGDRPIRTGPVSGEGASIVPVRARQVAEPDCQVDRADGPPRAVGIAPARLAAVRATPEPRSSRRRCLPVYAEGHLSGPCLSRVAARSRGPRSGGGAAATSTAPWLLPLRRGDATVRRRPRGSSVRSAPVVRPGGISQRVSSLRSSSRSRSLAGESLRRRPRSGGACDRNQVRVGRTAGVASRS